MDKDFLPKKELKELPVQLKLDLYVEVVISALIGEGKLDPKKLYIKPRGTFKRSYQSELDQVEVLENRKAGEQSVFFSIHREGLYDMLPEGLFHKNLIKTKHIDTEESVQELKMHQEEEKHARHFFLPLEQEFYQQRIQIEIEEQKSLVGVSEFIINELIANFWKINFPLEHDQALCLAYMLPMMHRIVGNFELTARSLEIILQAPVRLNTRNPRDEKILLGKNKVGYFSLGENFILGDVLSKEVNDLTLAIGPISGEELLYFLPGGKKQALLDLLAGYFIPAEIDWETELLVNTEEEKFELATGPEMGLLNYTTVI